MCRLLESKIAGDIRMISRQLKTALVASLVAAMATTATAADIYSGESMKDTPTRGGGYAIDWSGAYFGVGAGYSIANTEITGIAEEDYGFSFDGISSDGFTGCGILGAQKQAGQIVFGVEGRGCWGNVSTDVSIEGQRFDGPVLTKEAVSGDVSGSIVKGRYSYAAYGKLGVARGSWLVSILAGYKWQNVESDFWAGDETISGLSGGAMIEVKLGDEGRWNLGLEAIATQYNTEHLGSEWFDIDLDTLEITPALRLTYQIGGGRRPLY